MHLKLGTFRVSQVVFGRESRLEGGVLSVNPAEIEALVRSDPRVREVRFNLAEPGSRTRIIRVLDVIEPRYKVTGQGVCFPGFLGPPGLVGGGTTYRLEGVNVVTTGTMGVWVGAESGLRTTREAIIDMSGPGATYSPFSGSWNLVVETTGEDSLSIDATDEMIRLAGLRVTGFLGALSANCVPDYVEQYELGQVNSELPKVIYIYQIQSDGVTRHTFLYGQDLYRPRPVYLHPNEIIDGALVNGSGSELRIMTAIHCNNRVVKELYQRHGKELNFLGVILTDGSFVSETEKSRNAYHVARLAKALGANGAILTQQASGNSVLDQMLMCRYCEELGIRTVLITFEWVDAQGEGLPLIVTTQEANAIISTGIKEARVQLPAMERVFGGKTILFTDIDAAGELNVVTLGDVASATDQSGFLKLRGVEY
jgi:glycine reductase complex component B subunit alpha and beta